MGIVDSRIDAGKPFDWGRVSSDYAKYRDIYPPIFYQKIVDRDLCVKGQTVLDIGTGTGVLPRNLYPYGAKWVGTDLSEEQIEQAKQLCDEQHKDISFYAVPAEKLAFATNSFDVVTACQCFWYFDHKTLMPLLSDLLKPNGRLLILYMAWLPFEDAVAGACEKLVLQYNPDWSGAGETRHPIDIPPIVYEYFDMVSHEEYNVSVPFTRDSWHGRLKACRGVGASLSTEQLAQWEQENRTLLERIAPSQFDVRHYAALAELRVRK